MVQTADRPPPTTPRSFPLLTDSVNGLDLEMFNMDSSDIVTDAP